MQSAKSATETQACSKCGRTKPMDAFRRQSHRACGRDSICRACRKAADEEARAKSFGPLPGRPGSGRWLAEIRRRARQIRAENEA
jgi:hypothetical protein